jgi:predicted PurR-regulated permease PerM
MPSPSLPQFTRYVLVVIGLVALALFLAKIAPILMLVFAGIVLAAVIRAAASPLARRTGIGDSWAVGIVAFLIAALAIAGFYFFGREVLKQTGELWSALQSAWERVRERVGDWPVVAYALENLQAASSDGAMSKAARGTFTAFGALADVILVVVLAVYLALDPATYRKGLLMLLPAESRPRIGAALDAAGTALRRWLVGQLGAMLFVGVLAAAGLALVGVPLAVPLGILLGVLDFVPVVGPLVAAIPGVLIAFAQSPQMAFYAALVYLAVQFVEGHVVIPIAQKRAVAMPPALALVGIVTCGLVFGAAGVLFALPLTVVTMVLVQKLYVE